MKLIQAQQLLLISYDDKDAWEDIAEYATNHQQAMDAHDIVDEHLQTGRVLSVTLADATQAYALQRQSRPLSLKLLECMIATATLGARCTLASPRLELMGFLAQRAKHLQMTNLASIDLH